MPTHEEIPLKKDEPRRAASYVNSQANTHCSSALWDKMFSLFVKNELI